MWVSFINPEICVQADSLQFEICVQIGQIKSSHSANIHEQKKSTSCLNKPEEPANYDFSTCRNNLKSRNVMGLFYWSLTELNSEWHCLEEHSLSYARLKIPSCWQKCSAEVQAVLSSCKLVRQKEKKTLFSPRKETNDLLRKQQKAKNGSPQKCKVSKITNTGWLRHKNTETGSFCLFIYNIWFILFKVPAVKMFIIVKVIPYNII